MMTERLGVRQGDFAFSASRDRTLQELSGQKRKAVTYDLFFDRATYQELATLRSHPETYKAKKEEINGYTQTQLKTTLSERFNVLSSTITYEIRDGLMYGENTDEPFINMLIRGRDYRKEHGSPLDHKREQAEVDGFSLIEAVMTDKNTQPGTMMVSISPRGEEGSVYKNNFYDVYTLKEDESGRSIQMQRFSAGLTREEFARKAQILDATFAPENTPSDAEFLRRPLKILPQGNFTNSESVHSFLHSQHEYMSLEEFENEILKHCAPLILSYINTLSENPHDSAYQALIFNAILNKSDERAGILKRKQANHFVREADQGYSLHSEIQRLGRLPVRVVDTGCGELGGSQTEAFGSPATGAFSVGFFSGEQKNWSYTWGECIVCDNKFTQVGPCKICKTCEKKFD